MNHSLIDEAVVNIQNTPSYSPALLSFLPVLASKWIAPVLWALIRKSPLSFQEIRSEIGPITNTTLSKTLREMELEGLIQGISTEAETKPDFDNMDFEELPVGQPTQKPSGLYKPTQIGIEFSTVLVPLLQWATKYRIQQYGTGHKR